MKTWEGILKIRSQRFNCAAMRAENDSLPHLRILQLKITVFCPETSGK